MMDMKCPSPFGYEEKVCCKDEVPGRTNFAVVTGSTQIIASNEKVNLEGGNYQNKMTLTPPYIVNFPSAGMYKIDFIVSATITQAGPLTFGFNVSPNGGQDFGMYAAGVVNSTTSGLQVSGTGLVEIKKAPTTGYLVNGGSQPVEINYVRLNIIKIS